MHDNIFPLLENNRGSSHTPNGFSFLQDIYSKTISSQQSSTYTRTDMQQTLDNVSSSLIGTGSIAPKVTRLLHDDSNRLLKCQLPVDPPHTVPYSIDSSAIFRNKIPTHDQDDSQGQAINETSGMSIYSDGSISPRCFEYQASSDMSLSVETSSLRERSVDSPTPSSVNSFPLGDKSPSVDSPPLSNTPLSVDSSPLSDTPLSIEISPSSTKSFSAKSPPSSAELSPLTSSKTSDNDEQPKKKARTNYTNEQIQALLKVFHETPYPDSEMMENIGKDLGIPEKKVKIWFQNKRARWRRRINDNRNSRIENLFPTSPVPPYTYVPTGHMMTSSPLPNVSGYYSWMQSCLIPNKNLNIHRQFSTNQMTSNGQGANGAASAYPFVSLPSSQYSGALSQQRMTSFVTTLPSSQYSGALPQHRMTPFILTLSSQYNEALSQQRLASEQTKHSNHYPL